jgi:hypothetical protein
MGIDTGLHWRAMQAGGDHRINFTRPTKLERETGIEPASLAWKAKVLPLNYSRRQNALTVNE